MSRREVLPLGTADKFLIDNKDNFFNDELKEEFAETYNFLAENENELIFLNEYSEEMFYISKYEKTKTYKINKKYFLKENIEDKNENIRDFSEYIKDDKTEEEKPKIESRHFLLNYNINYIWAFIFVFIIILLILSNNHNKTSLATNDIIENQKNINVKSDFELLTEKQNKNNLEKSKLFEAQKEIKKQLDENIKKIREIRRENEEIENNLIQLTTK